MSRLHVHELTGFKPDGLATYLAALGVLRLIAQQKDAEVRGSWRDERFVLVSELDREALMRFFLDEYKPTPILAPWSGGGGFLDEETPTGDSLANSPLAQLTGSVAPRLGAMREAIAEAREVVPKELPLARAERDRLTARLREAARSVKQCTARSSECYAAVAEMQRLERLREEARERVEQVKATVKVDLLKQTRHSWRGTARDWFDSAVILTENAEAAYAPHLGTGGNDGNQDYTSGFHKNLNLLFDLQSGASLPIARARLNSVLWGTSTAALVAQTVGQFSPGIAGGTNMRAGFEGEGGINPWEFVFMLEGAVVLVAGMSRRGEVGRAKVSAPFWVEGTAAGFASASRREKTKGPSRGEQWLPLWSRPMLFDELVELVREGRAQLGRGQARGARDLARSVARLGFARGVDAVQRFAYLQRNGDSTFAVSAGRFRVASRSYQELLEEVAPWIDRLVWHATPTKDNNPAPTLGSIAKRVTDSVFAVCTQDGAPNLWRDLLVALGEAEVVLLRAGRRASRRPLPRLSPAWLKAIDGGTGEERLALRLALSLASQHEPRTRDGEALAKSVRRHFMPLATEGQRPQFRLDAKGRVERDLDHVCVGRALVADAIALVERRSIWARSSAHDRKPSQVLPLEAVSGCEATLEEIGAWVRGEVSDEAVGGLVRPLLALDWDSVERQGGPGLSALRAGVPEPLQIIFRLAHLPFPVPILAPGGRWVADVPVRLDPEPLRRLAATDYDGALRVTIRRLNASGLRPVIRRGVVSPNFARRLAASLAFPIGRGEAARAARLVCKPYDLKDEADASSDSV